MADEKTCKVLIKGERIYLRKLTEKDATEQYCGWLNDESVNKYFETKSEFSGLIKKILAAPHVRKTNTNVVLNVVKNPFAFNETWCCGLGYTLTPCF